MDEKLINEMKIRISRLERMLDGHENRLLGDGKKISILESKICDRKVLEKDYEDSLDHIGGDMFRKYVERCQEDRRQGQFTF